MSKRGPLASAIQPSREKYKCPVKDCKSESLRGDDITKHFQKLGTATPSDFIKNRIILEAKRQLLYSEYSVKEVAFDLGFNDPAYFTRFFTKATQKSPLNFKAEHKK